MELDVDGVQIFPVLKNSGKTPAVEIPSRLVGDTENAVPRQ